MSEQPKPVLSYEPTEADGSPRVLAGMSRPPWGAWLANPQGYIQCTCGAMLQTVPMIRSHWQDGHMDAPVYEVRG